MEGSVHCFKCAKTVVAEKDSVPRSLLNEYHARLEQHKKEVREFQQWLTARDGFASRARVTVPGYLSAAAISGLVGFLITPALAVLTIVLSLYFLSLHSDRQFSKQCLQYELSHPQPRRPAERPEYPSPTYTKHSLVRIRTGKQCSRKEILSRDGNQCVLCESSENLEVHHIRPRADWGNDDPTNLVTLCKHCHDREDWYGHKHAFPTTIKNEVKGGR